MPGLTGTVDNLCDGESPNELRNMLLAESMDLNKNRIPEISTGHPTQQTIGE